MLSYGASFAFAAIIVYNDLDVAGILAVQIPSKELNNGMGETGEVFLVGRNYLIRTDSRFLTQHPKRYLERLKSIGAPLGNIELIRKLNTTHYSKL